MKKHDFRSLKPVAQEALRIRAFQAVLDGATQVSVAWTLDITTEAVRQWMRRYESGGMKTLKAQPRSSRLPQFGYPTQTGLNR